MGGKVNQTLIVAAAATGEVGLVDGAPATRIKIMPIGELPMRGPAFGGAGPYRVRDRAHAEQIVAATRDFFGEADMPADFDHQMAFAVKPGVGGQAKAAAWIKPANITAEDDGIYANQVEYTAAAAQALSAREYRYISPLFTVADNGDVAMIKNFGFVNIGAIRLPAVAAGVSEDHDHMELTALAALLGLAEDATADDVAAAIGSLKTAGKPDTSSIAVAAGLAVDADLPTIAAAVAAMRTGGAPDPTKFVPIEQLESVSAKLTMLTDERAERVVAAAIESGKLAPAAKHWGLDLFKKDEVSFNTWLSHAPQVVAAGAELDERKPNEKRTALTADEIAACDASGISHADYLAAINGSEVAA